MDKKTRLDRLGKTRSKITNKIRKKYSTTDGILAGAIREVAMALAINPRHFAPALIIDFSRGN